MMPVKQIFRNIVLKGAIAFALVNFGSAALAHAIIYGSAVNGIVPWWAFPSYWSTCMLFLALLAWWVLKEVFNLWNAANKGQDNG